MMIVSADHETVVQDRVKMEKASGGRQKGRKMRMTLFGIQNGKPAKFRKKQMIK
jgi:hypothetical protein